MTKQITMAEWVTLIERFSSTVNGGGPVKARIFNSGRSLELDGGIVCSAQVSLRLDEGDPDGLRYLPDVDVPIGIVALLVALSFVFGVSIAIIPTMPALGGVLFFGAIAGLAAFIATFGAS